jgi:hypothetical protein
VADHELGDVRGHPVHDGVRDEQPPEIVGGEQQRGAGDAGESINGNVCVALVAR